MDAIANCMYVKVSDIYFFNPSGNITVNPLNLLASRK